MRAKTNSIRILLFVPLFLLALVLVLVLTRRDSTLRGGKGAVILRQPESVSAILIVAGEDSLYLEKQGVEWLMGGQEKANGTAVENLLYALSHFSISALAEEKNVSEGKQIEVSCLDSKHTLYRSTLLFAAGRTWLRQPGKSRLYGVSLPGFPGIDLHRMFDPSGCYVCNNLIVNLNSDDIATIHIFPYRGEPFVLQQDEAGEIRLEAGDPPVLFPAASLDERKIRLLLTYFRVATEGKWDPVPGLSERPGELMSALHVTDRKGDSLHLEVYPLLRGEDSEPDPFMALVRLNGGEDYLRVKYVYLDVLMRGAGHYLHDGKASVPPA